MGPESGGAEVACESDLGGVITTGGGFSTYNPTPSWQTDAVNAYFNTLSANQQPTSGYNRNGRGYPDISLIGVWYQVVVQGQMTSLFGTSASAPVLAGMISLINAARAENNQSSVGFINPTLYLYGKNNTYGSNNTNYIAYNDITSGANFCTAGSPLICCESGFYTTTGWDPVTGFGSINYPNLAYMFDIHANYTTITSSSNSNKSKLSTGAIVGIVIAGLIVGGGLLFLFGYLIATLLSPKQALLQSDREIRNPVSDTHENL